MKILLVEDQDELRELVRNFLLKNKYIVDEASDGEEALELLNLNSYDCVVLDLNLPKIDGIEVTKSIRRKENFVSIIMLTARSQIYDKLTGFDIGADDYITKPFDMKELLARIKAIVRRSNGNAMLLKFADYEVLPDMNILRKGKEEVRLTNKEMGVLEYLLVHKNKIVSAEELLEHVWDREVDMFTDTVKTHIKTLRKKIDPHKKYIKTVRGKGYVYRIKK